MRHKTSGSFARSRSVVVVPAAWVAAGATVVFVVLAAAVATRSSPPRNLELVDRPRPVFDAPLATASSSSFPSGHSAGTAAVVGLLFVVAVAASRVILGVHYPSDVVGGLLLGFICAATAWAVLTARAREPT